MCRGSGAGASLASKLRSLSSESFVQLLSAIFMIVQVMHTFPCLLQKTELSHVKMMLSIMLSSYICCLISTLTVL